MSHVTKDEVEMRQQDYEKEVPLVGYTDRLSGRPGDVIRAHISFQGMISARLFRSISADPNPDGPGIIEEDASEFFAPRTVLCQRQTILSGSFAETESNLTLPSSATMCTSNDSIRNELNEVQICLWFLPTSIPYPVSQCLLSWGVISVHIQPTGQVLVLLTTGDNKTGTKQVVLMTPQPLKAHKWYHLSFIVQSNSVAELTIRAASTNKKRGARNPTNIQEIQSATGACPWQTIVALNAPFRLASNMSSTRDTDEHENDGKEGGSFNGKIEAPEVFVDGDLLASWDLSMDMSLFVIPPKTMDQLGGSLILRNAPTRAVKGRLWDASEFHWTHKPSHYAAVYFHDDDVYDFDWKSNFEWTIPNNTPSGVYVIRVQGTEEDRTHEDALPVFVCPPTKRDHRSGADVCILVPTFTYIIYGNHARSDFQTSWLDRVRDWKGAYPYNPKIYPKYGLSTYNYHRDGISGICHASHKRPLFNLRPGFVTFGDASTVSGLRHFPADSHLITWLHKKCITYDLITDNELHNEGAEAITGYKTVLTGSHPEYHTMETLNALEDYRDNGGNLIYLGGNGFYWRIVKHPSSLLEIRRAEDGIRVWAAEPGEYYSAFDGSYGGLWRRNDRPPQELVGVGFSAQGSFVGMPYKRVCFDATYDWVFQGIDETILGDFGFSGGGAAGFELDRSDRRLDGGHDIIVLAQSSYDKVKHFVLVTEEVLTQFTNLSGEPEDDAKRADMVYFKTPSGGQVFSVGSITFCGSLPWNDFDNNISTLLSNILSKFTSPSDSR